MGKLIKAELFRTKRINGFWVCVFFTFLYMIAVPYVTDIEVNSAEKYFTSAMSGISPSMKVRVSVQNTGANFWDSPTAGHAAVSQRPALTI